MFVKELWLEEDEDGCTELELAEEVLTGLLVDDGTELELTEDVLTELELVEEVLTELLEED